MQYLHTMVRISNIDESLDFYCGTLGLIEINRMESEQGRFTLIFLCAPEDRESATHNKAPLLELTYNWDAETYTQGRNFGHLAFRVDDIYDTCHRFIEKGYPLHRPPRDGHMAFVRSPDGISVELLQKGNPLLRQEPWVSMPNIGNW